MLVGWPGSVHDGRVWRNSTLKQNLATFLSNIPSVPVAAQHANNDQMHYEHVSPFILADSAYPSTKHIVPTFRTTECNRDQTVKKLNKKLSSIRYCIEQAFGICKGRFRLLQRPLECSKDDVTRATKLITVIFTLHNFIIDQNLEEDNLNDIAWIRNIDDDEEEEVEEEDEEEEEEEDNATRNILLRHMRWLGN